MVTSELIYPAFKISHYHVLHIKVMIAIHYIAKLDLVIA
jgi:hypothetical protein